MTAAFGPVTDVEDRKMDRTIFLKLLAQNLYPEIRRAGFKGSGATLRQVKEPVAHVVNFQGSTSADGVYINLGVTLDFLKMEGIDSSNLRDVDEYQCVFRERLEPSTNSFGRWRYGSSVDEATQQIGAITVAWRTVATEWFSRHSYPDGFKSMVHRPVPEGAPSKAIFVLAKIARHFEDTERARILAHEALNRVPPAATSLRTQLQKYLDHDLA
ncbi:MAG: DUF4304 domain-containing protein [Pseudomonadota bacterium]